MRSNLRLDWRALALLGALLTIMIKWPGEAGGMGLVHAMPIITTKTTAPKPISARDFFSEQTTTTKTTATLPMLMKILNLKRNEIVKNSYHYNDDNKNVVNINKNNNNTELSLLLTTSSAGADVISDDTTPVYNVNEKITTSKHSNNIKDYVEIPKINENDNDSGEYDDYNNNNDNNNNDTKRIIEGLVNSKKNNHSSSQINTALLSPTRMEKYNDAEHKKQLRSDEQELHNFQSTTKNQNLIPNRRKRININNNQMQEKDIMELQYHQQGKRNYSINNELIRNSNEIESKNLVVESSSQHIDNVIVGADKKIKKMTSVETVAEIEQFKFSSHNHITILSRTERSLQEAVGDSIVRRSPHITHGSNVGGLKSRRLNISRNQHNKNQQAANNNLDRNERSTMSHLTGPSRKIQLFIKNRYLQLLPDGTINGTQDDLSEYAILQRSTVDIGRIKIQSVATCLYLCMDSCGAVFSSIDFTDDCIFNENMEQHNYNTYSSTYNSNSRRTNYLALNRYGEPRKLQIPTTRSLGKLATYTNAITETVAQDRVEQLIAKNFGVNRVKHGIRQLCDTGKPLIELIDRNNFKARPSCNPNTSSNNNNSNSNSSSSMNSTHSSSSSNSIRNSQLTNNVPAANDNHNNKNLQNINVNSKNNSHDDHTNIYHHTHHLQHNSSSNDSLNISLNNTSSGDSYKYDNQSSNTINSNISTISNNNNNNDTGTSNSTNSSNSTIRSNNITILSSSSTSSISSRSRSSSGHISNITSSIGDIGLAKQHHSSLTNHQHKQHQPKKKKRRKCRQYENEEEHNCRKGPQALRNRSNSNKNNKNNKQKLPKCKDLNVVNGETLTACIGPKSKNHHHHHGPHHLKKNNNQRNNTNIVTGGRRSKKQNQPMNQLGSGHGLNKNGGKNNNKNKKRNNQNKHNNNNNNRGKKLKSKQNQEHPTDLKNTSSTTLRTLEKTTPVLAISTTTHLSGLESTTIYDGSEADHLESTTAYIDRREREQRNVPLRNSLEVTAVDLSEDNDENASDEYPTSSELDKDSKEQNDNDGNNTKSDDEEPATEADGEGSSSYEEQAQFTGGTDDFLYYDQLDFAPMALWQLIALLWILPWFSHIL